MINFGISSTIKRNKPLQESIKLIGDSYFKWIEIRCEEGHFDYDRENEIKNIGKELRKNRVKVSSLHPPAWVDIGSCEEWTRMKSVREVEKCILISKKLNAERVIIHPGDREGSMNKLFESLEEIAGFAGEWDVMPLIENTFPGYIASEPEILLDISNRFNLSICLDTSHAAAKGDRVGEYIDRLGERIRHLHLSDSYQSGNDDHLIPGEGEITWEPLWKFLETFNGFIIFELPPDDKAEDTINQLDSIRMEWLKYKIAP